MTSIEAPALTLEMLTGWAAETRGTAAAEFVEYLGAILQFSGDRDGFSRWLAEKDERDERRATEAAEQAEAERQQRIAETQAEQEAEARDLAARGGHRPGCRCRTDANGKRIADMGCLDPTALAIILALIAARQAAAARAAV